MRMVRVDEKVAVSVDRSGSPIGFSWRDGHYLVSSKPVRWFARRQWWIESARVQRGIGAGVLEVEMWRVMAENSKKPACQYEFVHDALTDTWRLTRIYE
jgi:hypothetical protein